MSQMSTQNPVIIVATNTNTSPFTSPIVVPTTSNIPVTPVSTNSPPTIYDIKKILKKIAKEILKDEKAKRSSALRVKMAVDEIKKNDIYKNKLIHLVVINTLKYNNDIFYYITFVHEYQTYIFDICNPSTNKTVVRQKTYSYKSIYGSRNSTLI